MPIAALQIFYIGFIIGLTGPCLLYCLPVTLALGSGVSEGYKKTLSKIAVFLCGRVAAYTALGFLAGISGLLLRQFADSDIALYFKPAAGLISIAFGVYFLFYNKEDPKNCRHSGHGIFKKSGSFIFGITVGLSPCPPLMALLLEITLISKTSLHGAVYGLMFGMGTMVSGFILAGGLSGIFNMLPKKIIPPPAADRIFRFVSAFVLILFGVILIMGAKI